MAEPSASPEPDDQTPDVKQPDSPQAGIGPSPGENEMRPFRERIDTIDRTILELLNERAVCANNIGHIKKKLGLPIYMPAREDEVLANVSTSNDGPLPNDAVRRVFERIIDETRSLERRTYQ
jgi:chorismate mutase